MSDNAKKPGTRDISDLKARLGLKKGGSDGRAPTQGVPAPGAAKLGGAYVPPPPGVAPPPGVPQQPPIPDATVDPFAAMNAMAAQAAVHRAPEIVIVNDGRHETVNKKSPLRFLKYLLVALIPLVLGFVLGGINRERSLVGLTIGDAEVLHKDINDTGRKLQALQNTLFTAKDKTGGKGFVLFDKDLVEALATTDLGIPKDDPSKFLIYKAHLYTMDPKLVSEVLMFYTDMRRLQVLIDDHVRVSREDMQRQTGEAIKALGGETGLAAIVRTPKGGGDGPPPPPMIEIVQLGAPVCEDEKVHPEGCQGPPKGFQFRSDNTQGSPWGTKAVVKDQLTIDNLIPLGDSGVLRTIVKGSQKTIEEMGWYNRVREIDELAENLNLRRKDIENKMNSLRQRGKPFAI